MKKYILLTLAMLFATQAQAAVQVSVFSVDGTGVNYGLTILALLVVAVGFVFSRRSS